MQAATIGSAGGSGRERPRLREDLVAELVEAPGARFIDVMAPDSGNVFRFYEVEYSLACGMDGERDIAGIVKWAQDELGLTPSPHEVRTVIATLGDLGFIDAETGAERAAGEAPAAELAPGVVVTPPARPQPSSGFELGTAGAAPARGAQMTPAPEVALGTAGAGPRITRPTPAPSIDVALGAPGSRPARPTPRPTPVPADVSPDISSDVSIDLSDHIAVRPDDVKEAVRASKVMTVEVPPDIADVIDSINERPTTKAPALEPAYEDTERTQPPDTERSLEAPRAAETARSLETRPEIRVGKSPPSRQPSATRPPVELPAAPVTATVAKPLSPPAPSRGVSPVLIVLLVLAVLGGGVFLVWKYVLAKPSPDADVGALPAPVAMKPPPPSPPPALTAKIVLETPAPDDVKLTRAGVIENILTDKAVVKEGDIILRLVGDKPIEAELTGLGREQKRLKDAIDAATRRRDTAHGAGNKAAETAAETEIADRQKTLRLKEDQLAKKMADLDNFMIHATASGVFSPAAKPGQKVVADAVVARIQRDAIPVATFKVSNARPFAGNASVEVAIGKGEQRVTCTIADVQPDAVKLTCPPDPALTDGADVTLNAPAATASDAPAPPPAPSETAATAPAGSAAAQPEPGSGAPPAGGSPGSGSAQP
ncbi:MAG TPA: hypothetical protein VGD37_13850 [Kofleriaceae bacterium]